MTRCRPKPPFQNKPYGTIMGSNLISISPLPTNNYSTDGLRLVDMNARSVGSKTSEISDFVTDEKQDFLLITETWINNHASYVCDQITPKGYSILQVPITNVEREPQYYAVHPTIQICTTQISFKDSNLSVPISTAPMPSLVLLVLTDLPAHQPLNFTMDSHCV